MKQASPSWHMRPRYLYSDELEMYEYMFSLPNFATHVYVWTDPSLTMRSGSRFAVRGTWVITLCNC